ncbi:MAG: hypothetical protein Q8N69_03585, partial [bacterium]|nr:hypothetical protein [bacterium]
VGIVTGVFSERDKIKKLFILFFTAAIAFFALTAGPEAYYKMRFPVDPLIFILAFYGLWRVAIKFEDKFPCLRKIYT